MQPIRSYVALGDSFTEGVGDHECRDARLRHVNGLTARRPALEPVDTLLDPH